MRTLLELYYDDVHFTRWKRKGGKNTPSQRRAHRPEQSRCRVSQQNGRQPTSSSRHYPAWPASTNAAPPRRRRTAARLGFAVTDISFRSPKVKAHKKFLSSVFVLASLKLLLAQEHLKSDDFPFTFSYTLLCHSACCENISSYLILFNGRLPRKGTSLILLSFSQKAFNR